MRDGVVLLWLFLIAGMATFGALLVFVVDLLNWHEIANRINSSCNHPDVADGLPPWPRPDDRLNMDGHDGV